MAAEPVRLGVIGCGVMGQRHMAAAKGSAQIEVVAVADVRAEAAKEAAAKFGVPAAYRSAGALLKDKRVEAVVLALPAAPRTKLALKAFSLGKHVLTEKPVAMNAREVKKMIAAKGSLVGACCSARMRFLPSADAATGYIASGALGSIRTVQCRCLAPDSGAPKSPPPAWRLIRSLNGGGVLMNWGCYDLDYLLGVCGWKLKPKLVLAQTWTVAPELASHVAPGSDAETHVAAIIRCEGGEVITFERGEYCAAQKEDSWRIVGTKASLHLGMTAAKGKKILADVSSPDAGVSTQTVWEGDEEWDAIHAFPVRDFAAAIREGRPPKTPLEQALVVQQISDAVYASAAKGKAVAIQ